jgi:hypothetical protein
MGPWLSGFEAGLREHGDCWLLHVRISPALAKSTQSLLPVGTPAHLS